MDSFAAQAIFSTMKKLGISRRALIYKIRAIDEEKREIAFSDGTTRKYDRLLSTMPLDALVARFVLDASGSEFEAYRRAHRNWD